MSTEYRRGIPSTAHVEAATRLGLLWLGSDMWLHRFRNRNGQIEVWYFEDPNATPDWEAPDFAIEDLDFRPIRPDGTPVDWEVLDQEVARVGQSAPAAPAAPPAPAQPQGFRADLWARICTWVESTHLPNIAGIASIDDYGIVGQTRRYSWSTLGLDTQTDEADRQALIARWTVYQELKPLYDLVDGVQGEAAMPRDVEAEWSVCSGGSDTASGNWRLCRNGEGLYAQGVCAGLGGETAYVRWHPSEGDYGVPLRNFAAVLDAVAERRVAERMQEQTQAPTVTPAQPQPRRFADVRPDRHGWRWWRDLTTGDCFTIRDGVYVRRFDVIDPWLVLDLSAWLDRTVIPTDEQGNPVSWEAAGFAAEAVREAQESVQRAANDATPARSVGDIEWTATGQPVTRHMTVDPVSTLPPPLPRFTADELDDVDHSKTTKLDEATLRRGKLPTVEQIAKYREVRARRTGGAVADALKESRIDCEVAQYVLERWAGGLDNTVAHKLIAWVVETTDVGLGLFVCSAEARAQQWIDHHSPALDTSEKPSPTVQRERQEAEEQRQRLAELRQRLAAERAAQEMAKEGDAASRFDLIEPDPQADPAASIRAWEARQAAAKVRPTAAPPRIAKPATAPRRPAIEVVDAEVDGLSRSEVVTALVGRAFNGGC